MSAHGIAVELTRITKDAGPVTKRIHLMPDGSIGNDSSRCAIGKGTMERLYLPDWRAFAKLIEETPRNTAYALGVLRPDLPDSVPLVRKRETKPGSATRSKETIAYGAVPSLVLFDHDAKGMPQAVRLRLLGLGGFRGALEAVCPELATAGCISRMSTSANLVNEATGKSHQSHGEHLYLPVQDGTDARRFLYALHDLCWLAGLGWYIVGRAGQLLERSIIDKMVCAPERLVFEASPDLEPPLKQEKREATIREGALLDTRTACINLDKPGQAQLKRQKDAAAKALGKEAAGARTAFVEEKTGGAVARGLDEAAARLMAEQWGDSVLRPGVILEFDDRDLGAIDVAAILADPARFEGETLADPIEGVAYGRNCAIVQMRDGAPSIFSFAHGGARYELRPGDDVPPPAISGDGVEGGDSAFFSVTIIWLSEDTLALTFADRHAGRLRYVANWGKWLAWTGTHWGYEKALAVYDMARKICREFVQPRASPSVLLTKAQTVSAIEMLARSDRRIAATAEQWDADQLLFNMTEGSVELSNGAIMPNNSIDIVRFSRHRHEWRSTLYRLSATGLRLLPDRPHQRARAFLPVRDRWQRQGRFHQYHSRHLRNLPHNRADRYFHSYELDLAPDRPRRAHGRAPRHRHRD